jgi:hypothetical protein
MRRQLHSTVTDDGTIVLSIAEVEIPERFRSMVQARVGVPVPIGNEGAGTVVAAGSSDAAQALLGKTVATWAVRCTQSCASRATPPWCTPPPPPTSARCW